MDYLLSILKDIRTKKDIPIYIIGEYLRNKVLNRENNDITILVDGNVIEIIDSFILEFKDSKKIGENYIEVEKNDKIITLNFITLDNKNLEDFLKVKVFTIDSMALDILKHDKPYLDFIIDPYDGMGDISRKVIKHIDDKDFKNNPINFLKTVRLMGELDYKIDHGTIELIKDNGDLIKEIPSKDITREIFNMLKLKYTYKYFNFMENELKIMEKIFPEIIPMRDSGECKYHVTDCLNHSLYTLKILEDIIYSDGYFEEHIRKVYDNHARSEVYDGHNRLEFMKLGALFHDVGKPSAEKIDENGRTRFKGHEITGAEIVKDIAVRLGLSIKERDLLYRIVAKHMIPLVLYRQNDVSGKALFNTFSELGEDTLDILIIALADIMATRILLDPNEDMGKFKVHVEYMANNYLTRFKEVEDIRKIITGKDIMEKFDLDSNITVEELMEEVKKAIYYGKISPSKSSAIRYIEKIL